MSFSRYPAYKSTGADWLGDIPDHWKLLPLWTFFRRVKRDGFPSEPLLSVYRDHGVVLKSSRSDNFNKPSDDLSPYQLVNPDDLVINKMKAWQGSVAVSGCRGIVSPAYFVYQPIHTANPRYLHYLMRSLRYVAGYLSISKGIRPNQWDLDPQLHSRIPVVCPPAIEQCEIATFLDRETAKIDALIAEQERLIELLKEKRQAVISQAVTKGLNPSARTKPSGVAWMGSVPDHWAVMPIKAAARLESGHTPSRNHPEYWKDCTVPWFTLADIWQIREEGREVICETKEKISELGLNHSAARRLPAGTVMLSRTASVGFAAIMGVEMATTQDFANWVCGPNLSPQFLLCVFQAMSGEFHRLMMGSTHNTIYMPDINSMRFALPPRSEQQQIVGFIRETKERFSALTNAAEGAVRLLRERRAAIISAAVTGQIDVRGLSKQKAA